MTQETTRHKVSALIKQLGKNFIALSEALIDTPSQEIDHKEAEDKKNKKKKKADKDPNAPKRNLSSYMLYSQAVRPSTVEKHPDLKAVDIAKLIGEKWNALSDKEKHPYIKQAEKEKARFDKETSTYKASLGEEEKPSQKRKVVVEEPEVKKKSKKDESTTEVPTTEVPTKKKSSHKKKKN
ncbi:high mobility group box domain-containing protein [Thamnidium elegans]|nr:high mobility group box domain-containing protein [Thamnidium elegans]